FERDAGAGGILEEEVDDGLAEQGRQLLDLAGLGVGHVLGDVEDLQGGLAVETAGVEQVPHDSIVTSSTPSSSFRRTLTRSELAEGMFLPTKSGRIGSSRCPRSTRIASRTAAGRPIDWIASRAARMLRPEKSTSSTSTTVLPEMPPAGISVGCGERVGCLARSWRNRVTSRAPAWTEVWEMLLTSAPRR